MFELITGLVKQGGYLAVFLLMAAENIFPPIPSELIMPLAGFVADRGDLAFWPAILAGWLGSIAGQLPLYYLGAKIDEERLKGWVDRRGFWLAVDSSELERAQSWFERHGRSTIFFCRLIPGLRSLISVPAGLVRMPIALFLAYTAAGTLLWTVALTYAGSMLGRNYERVQGYLDPVSTAILIGVAVWYLWRVARSYRKSR